MRLAAARHLRDLARQESDAFPYRFEPHRVHTLAAFFEEFLTLDDGRPFRLIPWMQFVFGSLEGWRKLDGSRRFQTAYVETGKGSGKTPAAAGFGLFALADTAAPMAAEIYSLGVTRDQASYLFKYAKQMAQRSDDLRDLLDVGEHNIAWTARYSFFRPLSSEGRSLDNKRPYLAIVDELHEHPSAVIPDKMRLGFKGVPNAVLFEITNAGHDRTSVCWDHHEYSQRVLEQVVDDEQWFAYMCQLDTCESCRAAGATQPNDGCPDCDHWTDEAVWPKANPSLGVTIPVEYLRGAVKEALNRPGLQARVKRLNFCIWTQSHTVWIPSEKWDACKTLEVTPQTAVAACTAGFDLSEKLDLTACVVALRIAGAPDEEIEISEMQGDQEVKKTLNLNFYVDLIPYFWLPEETLLARSKGDQIPYDVWHALGFLRVTPGPIIDHDLIYEEFVKEIYPQYKPSLIGYDRHNARQFGIALRDQAKFGERVVEVEQGRALSESFKLFEALVHARRIRHNGNPILAWCVANSEPKYDRYRNLWIEKDHATSKKKIDGVIAAVEALSLLKNLEEPKQYQMYIFGGHR